VSCTIERKLRLLQRANPTNCSTAECLPGYFCNAEHSCTGQLAEDDTCGGVASHECRLGLGCKEGRCRSLANLGAGCEVTEDCATVAYGAVGCANGVCTMNWFRARFGESCTSPMDCAAGLYCKYSDNTSVCASGTDDETCSTGTADDPCVTLWTCKKRLLSHTNKVRSECTAEQFDSVIRRCLPCMDAYYRGVVCFDQNCLRSLMKGIRCMFSDVDDSPCGAQNAVGEIADTVDWYDTSAGSAMSWSGAAATAAALLLGTTTVLAHRI
jgi:hypothetical protein